MKKQIIMALLMVALLVAIFPINALAAETFWNGAANITVTEPITIANTGGDGTYDDATHTWAVSIVGGGTKTLKMTATNNSASAYTVNAIVSPAASGDGKVTAAWNSPSRYIAAGTSYEFILTVHSSTDAVIQAYSFAMSFTR
jgi:hypothetical protein